MPLLIGLEPLIQSLMVALLALAADLVMRAIGNGIGSVGIGPVNWNIGKFFTDKADAVVNWVLGSLWPMFKNLGDWFLGHSIVFMDLAGAVVSAVQHLGDQVDHIVTVSIPNGIRAAEAAAGAHAQGLINTAEDKIADAYRAAAGGFDEASRWAWEHADHAADNIGNNILGAVSHGVDSAINYTDGRISTLDRELTQAIADARTAVEGELTDVKKALTKTIGDLANTVAGDYQSALSIAQGDATTALTTAKGLITQARTDLTNIAAADANTVQDHLNSAVDTINATVDKLTGTVSSDFTAAENFATSQVAQGLQDVTDVLTGTAATVGGAIEAAAAGVANTVAGQVAGVANQAAAAEAGLQTQIGQAVAGAQQDANNALDAAEAAVGGALGKIYTDVTGQALAYNGDLSSIAGTLGIALAGALAGVTARVAKLEQCSVGVCDDSPNNFSNLLQAALGVADMAAVFTFLSQLVSDPAGAEQQYAGLIQGLYTQGHDLFDQLLNL